MFHKIWDFIKAHPYAIGGGLILLIILYVVFNSASSGGSSTTAAAATGPSDAEVQADAATQIASIQAGAAANQTSAQLQGLDIQAQVSNYQTEQAANVQQSGIVANENIQINGNQSQVLIAQASDALQASLASTQASTDQARIGAVVAIANAPTNLAIAQINGLGPNGLTSVITNAEDVKNSSISIGGITAGRNTPASTSGGAIAGAAGSIFASLASII